MHALQQRPHGRKTPAPDDDLFGWQDWPPSPQKYPDAPGFKAPGTSQEAAASIAASAKNLRGKVLAFFRDNSPAAFSADELAIRLRRSPLSVRPRVSELAAAGLIEKADERTKNESGMTAARWRAKQ